MIGWFGTLRCVRSLAILEEVAAALRDEAVVYLRGYPTETGLDAFLTVVGRHPNMVYDGEFMSPQDLADIYGRVHLSWCFDFTDAGTNSDWLLPNRLYDSGYNNTPGLAAAGSETGRRLESLGMGWALPAPFADGVVRFIRDLTPEAYRRRCEAVTALPRETFRDDRDVTLLIDRILAERRPAAGTGALAREPQP